MQILCDGLLVAALYSTGESRIRRELRGGVKLVVHIEVLSHTVFNHLLQCRVVSLLGFKENATSLGIFEEECGWK